MSDDSSRPARLAEWRQSLDDLDRRIVPAAATALERLVGANGRLDLAPNARRVLGAISLVLLGCALALFLIGS